MKLCGLASSTGEAMRLIKQGGVTVNDQKLDDPDAKLSAGTYLFKVGKRKFLRISPKR
jgi:tyrosyl-tRNA synthetase